MKKPETDQIKIIAGLGNPDLEHKNTYHNIGKIFVNHLAGSLPTSQQKWSKYKNLFHYLRFTDSRPTLVKTLTYMNKSGEAIKQAAQNFQIDTNHLMVVHDDADIPLGQFKTSFDRGSAGHKGVQSIINHLGTKKFWRFRIGIRPKEDTRQSSEFVLDKIDKSGKEKLQNVFPELEKIVNL